MKEPFAHYICNLEFFCCISCRIFSGLGNKRSSLKSELVCKMCKSIRRCENISSTLRPEENELRFADEIDGPAGKQEELASPVDRLDKTSATFGMEISAEKTKLMTNNPNGISIDIRINGEKLDEVDSFGRSRHRPRFQA